jgi:alpha-L-fucosidase 2
MTDSPAARAHRANGDGPSRRSMLRAVASTGALLAMSSLPEFTSVAGAVSRPKQVTLVPESEAVTSGTPSRARRT